MAIKLGILALFTLLFVVSVSTGFEWIDEDAIYIEGKKNLKGFYVKFVSVDLWKRIFVKGISNNTFKVFKVRKCCKFPYPVLK